MNQTEAVTIPYQPTILWALQQEPEDFAKEARLLLAIKLYELERLSSGLAAELAGVPRELFLFLLGQYKISAFAVTQDELEADLIYARQAHRI
ncbi:UPF0175 family protein [Anaerolineales bacterium HSG6]|nr:UPF0175 family protein [Anaerolineales bacterium HSG6]